MEANKVKTNSAVIANKANSDLELLNAHYKEIYDAMVENLDMWPDYEKRIHFSWDFETDNDIYYEVEGECLAFCEWHNQGDGYWTPIDPIAYNGYGELSYLKITKINNETGQEYGIEKDAILAIESRLNADFNEFMSNYR